MQAIARYHAIDRCIVFEDDEIETYRIDQIDLLEYANFFNWIRHICKKQWFGHETLLSFVTAYEEMIRERI